VRILGEAIDYLRQGQVSLRPLRVAIPKAAQKVSGTPTSAAAAGSD